MVTKGLRTPFGGIKLWCWKKGGFYCGFLLNLKMYVSNMTNQTMKKNIIFSLSS